MKNKYLILYILFLLIITSCDSSTPVVSKPQDAGKDLFRVLKEFDPENKQQFENNFISLQTIHLIGNDRSLIPNKKRRDRYANMTEESYRKEIINPAYDIVNDEGYAFDIKWKDIKYTGFVFGDQKYSNLRSIKGKLVFEHDEKLYDVGCVYVRYDKIYYLAAITGIYLHGVNNPRRFQNPNLIEI